MCEPTLHLAASCYMSVMRYLRNGLVAQRTRQTETKRAALAGPVRGGPDTAAVGGDDALTDVQTQTAALETAIAHHAEETFEHLAQVLGGDAQPLIAHRDADLLRIRFDGDVDGTPARGVLDSVGNQVLQHLFDAASVPNTFDRRGRVHVDAVR